MAVLSIVLTSDAFSLGGRSEAGSLPVLVDDTLGVLEAPALYLRHRYSRQNASVGTLTDEIYIIREWLEFLRGFGSYRTPITDLMLSFWLRKQSGVSKARRLRKISVVHHYYTLGESLGFFTKADLGPFSTSDPPVTYPRAALKSHRARPTPSRDDVNALSEYFSRSVDQFIRTRNVLILKWKTTVGLRDQGLSHMKLGCLFDALKNVGLIDFLEEDCNLHIRNKSLIIRDFLQGLHEGGRTKIILSVTEKGPKVRYVPVPLMLFCETLEFVWGPREELVTNRGVAARNSIDGIFLSRKTLDSMTAKAIGRLLKQAFNDCKIGGSGHRLRAYFACNLVKEKYNIARQRHGQEWQAKWVLLEAAEILGHQRIETLRPYLDQVLREEWSSENYESI